MCFIKKYLLLIAIIFFIGCSKKTNTITVTAFNDLDIARISEIVAIKKSQLSDVFQKDFENLELIDTDIKKSIPIQFVDENGDGEIETIIFQPKINAKSSKSFVLQVKNEESSLIKHDTIAFSRFVPERVDDFAWENDKVAFRMFGPKAEAFFKQGISEGVSSSGIDCWLKRVEYPVINKWYKKYTDKTGDYHKDTGEGLDNFHVGTSLGCGGIGVFKDSTLYTSGNFKSFLHKENGAIRTSFELNYISKDSIAEIKKVSLEKGSHLTRFELIFDKTPNNLVAGFPLNKENAEFLKTNLEEGYFAIWQPHDDSHLGLTIVLNPKYISKHTTHFSQEKDQSHFFVHLKPIDNKIVYYTGFGWKKSNAFSNSDDWVNYLKKFSKQLQSPIRLTIK